MKNNTKREYNSLKFQDLSEKAQGWLQKHRYISKAENLKEYSNRLEFTEKSDRNRFVVLHTIYLPNGSWESHEIPAFAVKDSW